MSAAEAFAIWPQLRGAIQPRRLERVNGKFSFKVADEWSQLVQRVERGEFRLRASAPSTQGLCGPIVGHGPCLDPVFVDGDCYWIDPHCEAQDGDFVMLQWHPEKLRGIVERGRSKPEWLAEYGENPDDTALKWLRRVGNEYLSVTRRSAMPLGASPWYGGEDRALGVVRYVERAGKPIYGGPIVAHAIDPNAATDALQSSATNVAVSVANGVTSNRDFFDYIEVADLVSTDVIEVSASLNVTLTALGGDPTAVIAAAYGTTTPTAAAQGYSKVYTNAANQLISPVGTFTGLTGTYRFGVEANITHDSSGSTAAATAFNIELQVTVVKR